VRIVFLLTSKEAPQDILLAPGGFLVTPSSSLELLVIDGENSRKEDI
jgi:hypothetical protein